MTPRSCRRPTRLVVLALVLLGTTLPGTANGEDYSNQLAVKFLARDAFRAAARQFRADHQAQPDLGGPLAGMALCQCRLGHYDLAAEYLDESAQRDCCQTLLYMARSCMAGSEGDLIALEQSRLDAYRRSPEATAQSQLASFYVRQGRFAEALDVTSEMMDVGLRGRVSSDLMVRGMLGSGEVDEAALLAIEISAEGRGPHTGRVSRTLVALSEDPMIGEEVQGFRRYAQKTRTMDNLLVLTAEGLRRLGRLDDAEIHADRRKRDPVDPLGWALLVRLYADLSQFDLADEALSNAQRQWPCNPSVLLSEAHLWLARGDIEKVERALELAHEIGVPAWDQAVAEELSYRLRTR